MIVIAWAYKIDNSGLAILAFASILLVSYPYMGAINEKTEQDD